VLKLNEPGDISKIGEYLTCCRSVQPEDVEKSGAGRFDREPPTNAGYVSVVHFDMSNMGLKLIEPQATVNAATKSAASNIPFNLIPLPG
jgi:hypothetical protein